MVGVAEHVAGAVDAGALAVPDAEHAVVLAFAAQLGLLRAPQRRGGQVLVEAGHELDVVRLQQALGPQHGGFQGGDRRAAVAGHVAGRVEPRLHVAGALRQHQAHDGLGAGQDLPAFVEGVFVVEASRVFDHMGREPPGILCGPLAARGGSLASRCNTDARVRRHPQTCRGPNPRRCLPLEMGSRPTARNRLLPGESLPACRFPVQPPVAGSWQQNCQLCRRRSPAPRRLGCITRLLQRTMPNWRSTTRPRAASSNERSELGLRPQARRQFCAGHPRAHGQFLPDPRSAGVSLKERGRGAQQPPDRNNKCAAA